jgi:cell division GTPase FtsZ
VELTKILVERKNSLFDASEEFHLKEIDLKIVSLINEFICDDMPIILLDENHIKDIICGKADLYFGVVSATRTELDYEIQQMFKNQQLVYEIFEATNILVYVSCGKDTSIQVINKITSEIKQHVKPEVQMKIGCGINDGGEMIQVYIVGSTTEK